MFEYRVVTAPNRGVKAKGIKSNEARFAYALEQMMNDMARDGWEYQRAETLPSVERSGLASTNTNWRNVLVFRRPVGNAMKEEQDVAVTDHMPPVAPPTPEAPTAGSDLPENAPKEPPLTKQKSNFEDAQKGEDDPETPVADGDEETTEQPKEAISTAGKKDK